MMALIKSDLYSWGNWSSERSWHLSGVPQLENGSADTPHPYSIMRSCLSHSVKWGNSTSLNEALAETHTLQAKGYVKYIATHPCSPLNVEWQVIWGPGHPVWTVRMSSLVPCLVKACLDELAGLWASWDLEENWLVKINLLRPASN